MDAFSGADKILHRLSLIYEQSPAKPLMCYNNSNILIICLYVFRVIRIFLIGGIAESINDAAGYCKRYYRNN